MIFLASLYGHSGAANGAAEIYRENEELLAKAVLRLASKPNVPYFLGGDFNASPDDVNRCGVPAKMGGVIRVPEYNGCHVHCW